MKAAKSTVFPNRRRSHAEAAAVGSGSTKATPTESGPITTDLRTAYAKLDKADAKRNRLKQFRPQYRAKLATGEQD